MKERTIPTSFSIGDILGTICFFIQLAVSASHCRDEDEGVPYSTTMLLLFDGNDPINHLYNRNRTLGVVHHHGIMPPL